MGLLDMIGMGGGMTEGLFNSLANHSDQLSGLGAGLMSGSNWAEGLGNAFQMGSQGMKSDRARMEDEKRKAAAASYGKMMKLTPEEQQLFESNPELASQYMLKKNFNEQDQDRMIQRYNFARGQGYKGSLVDFMNMAGGDSGYGGGLSMNPTWMTGPDGKPAIGQLGKDGKMHMTEMPPGMTPSRGIKKVDLGTEWGFYDEASGALLKTEKKDLAGAAEQTATGKGIAESKLSYNGAKMKLEQLKASAKGLLDDKRLDGSVGGLGNWSLGGIKSGLAGTDSSDYRKKVKETIAQEFGASIPAMKNLGALSNAEGSRVETALANVDPDMSPPEFRAALGRLQEALVKLEQAMEMDARGQVGPQDAGGAPGGGAPNPGKRRYNPDTGQLE